MFEQNNLAINLPSPAAAYLGLARDEAALPDAAERAALELEVCGPQRRPFWDWMWARLAARKRRAARHGGTPHLPGSRAATRSGKRATLAAPKRQRALTETQLEPLRLALGEDLDSLAVEGTAFFALQSCCNHSCAPNAAAEGDPSGEARLVAARRIAKGEEVTISYVEEKGVGLEERRAALGAYGFECGCDRCAAEARAAGAGAV